MSVPPVVSIQPHAEVVWAVVQPCALDDLTVSQMQDEVLAAAALRRPAPVVLDLSNVTYIPSLGLGALVGLMRQLKQHGHRFVLVSLHPDVRATLALTRLDKLFEIHPRFEDAWSRLQGGP
jgi:anti-anti-sigma factor